VESGHLAEKCGCHHVGDFFAMRFKEISEEGGFHLWNDTEESGR
jgi:hypothetical protein